MEKPPRRIAAAVLCAGMLLSLAACGSGGGDAGDAGGPLSEATTSGVTTEAESIETVDVVDVGNGKRVYIAGPLFNQGEKDFNLRVAEVLEAHGYEVFLPQRDGIEAALLEGKSEEELTEMIFALDAEEVAKADIIFMNIDGRVPDEGACVELGIAYASGKRCYGFKTDTRAVEIGLEINPMITGCMIKIFKNYDGDQLLSEIDRYLSENEL